MLCDPPDVRLLSTPQKRTHLQFVLSTCCQQKSAKGRTIRYLRGGLGNNQKKIRAQKQSRNKNIVHNKPVEKKNRARTRGHF